MAYCKTDLKVVKERARQNVILELGYFLAALGHERVCALKKGDVETPSDIHGIVWVGMDESGIWKKLLLREIREAGLECREESRD
jgi:predicted nucleotide-binding protein